jgi:hypothetical protein
MSRVLFAYPNLADVNAGISHISKSTRHAMYTRYSRFDLRSTYAKLLEVIVFNKCKLVALQ